LRQRLALALLTVAVLGAGGCAGRPEGDLIPVAASAPGASRVEMLVATTRADAVEPPAGVMFSGERGRGLRFADIVVSIPPDSERKAGDVQWPSSRPGDPAHDFVTLRANKLDLKQAVAEFDKRVAAAPERHVLVFVHGYNTRFEEAVYRFAQIVHDSGAPVLPVLFTWPSRGRLLDYVYDRDSAIYSRDALEAVLTAMAKDAKVGSISILAHSMGNFLAVEALRQMAIRDRGLSPKIKDIMLASPDIDVDVFRRQIAEIEASDKNPPISLFVSQDDRALAFSSRIAGDAPRLGAIDPTVEPFRSILEKAKVHVIDLTKFGSDDATNHSKFATSDFVKTIGMRLASGQKLTDAKATFGQTVAGAVTTIGSTAVSTVTAPLKILDPSTASPTLEEQAAAMAQ
jgi:esterase/lipase superfamily enzyme